MEQEKSFYGQEVVCGSCLQIAIVDINYFWVEQRERMRAVQKDSDCNATAPFEIVDNVCSRLFVSL